MSVQALFWIAFLIILLIDTICTIIIYKYAIEKEFRLFEVTPSIAIHKSMKADKENFTKAERIILGIIYEVCYLPLTVVWAIGWVLYKIWCLIYKDDSLTKKQEVVEETVQDSNDEEPLTDTQFSREPSQKDFVENGVSNSEE